MSNEKQLTPIGEAIKYAKKRMEYWETQYECFEEEREFDSAGRCKLVASEFKGLIQFLQSLLPKETLQNIEAFNDGYLLAAEVMVELRDTVEKEQKKSDFSVKHRFENGKWMPDNGTFVKVPNDQIPEVIQLLRDNGHPVSLMQSKGIRSNHNSIFFDGTANELGGWVSSMTFFDPEIPFPDFKALVTGKLPESWCIQCTEESMKHPAWENMCATLFDYGNIHEIGLFYGNTGSYHHVPFGEVLQIETWAALNPVEESLPTDEQIDEYLKSEGYDLGEIESKAEQARQEFICSWIGKSTDEQLINELKSRGYTVSKIY